MALLLGSTGVIAESFPTPESLQAAVRTVGVQHDEAIELMEGVARLKLQLLATQQWNVGNPACRIAASTSPDEDLVAELIDAIVKTDVQFYSPPPKEYPVSLFVGEAVQRVCQATMVMR